MIVIALDSELTTCRSSDNTFNTPATQTNRDSYASTTPSSIESDAHAELASPKPDSPSKSSSHTFSFKSAARTFTLGSKNKPPPIPDQDAAAISASHRRGVRERAMTETSFATTAAPPRIDIGSDLGLGAADFGSGFGDIFAKRRSALLESGIDSDAQLATNNPSSLSPTRLDTRNLAGSPNSTTSHTSDDRLMQPPPLPSYFGSGEYEPSFGVDTDAELVMAAVKSGRFLNQSKEPTNRPLIDRTRAANTTSYTTTQPYAAAPSSSGSGRTALPSTPRPGLFGSQETTPKGKMDDVDDEPLFDPAKSARLAQYNTRSLTQAKQPSKVMTPAEFEEYRNQKDAGLDDSKSEASGESESYEDEDDTERERVIARQRRKQEAQLAVYRQQMMKVTGEQPSDLPASLSRPKLDRQSLSAPNLLSSHSNSYSNFDPIGGAKDEEDDEDVPLAVLQAHGFPSKSRPPSRLSPSPAGGRPLTQMSSYPAPPGSTRNEASAGGGGNGSLPVFARNLPSDPYVGANLVNQSARESMQFGAGSPAPSPSTALPPGGLVGVIAGEERARAMRRGSPNTRGTYDNMPLPPQMQPPMTMGGMPGMQMMSPTGQPMSPAEQAQMQMSNQMAQMMQMQMQWMQQMMQMQNMSPQQIQQMQMQMGMQMPQLQNGFPSPHPQRPVSQASNHQRSFSRQSGFLSPPSNIPGATQSVYGPSSSQSMFGMPAPGYAPSIAPSERTNIGQPSRYRPVSSVGVQPPRAMSMTRQSFLGPNGQDLRAPNSLGPGDGNRNSMIRAIDRPKKAGHESDEEDEQGWAELKKKKEERKSRWRRTKKSSVPQEGENGGLEGLYYEG